MMRQLCRTWLWHNFLCRRGILIGQLTLNKVNKRLLCLEKETMRQFALYLCVRMSLLHVVVWWNSLFHTVYRLDSLLHKTWCCNGLLCTWCTDVQMRQLAAYSMRMKQFAPHDVQTRQFAAYSMAMKQFALHHVQMRQYAAYSMTMKQFAIHHLQTRQFASYRMMMK